MNVVRLRALAFVYLTVLSASSNGEVERVCPSRVPLMEVEDVAVSWSYDPLAGRYTYTYTVTNPAGGEDYINTFWLRGTKDSHVHLGSPDGWNPVQTESSVMWAPHIGYSGGEVSIVSRASDADIGPGGTLSGFVISSVDPPSLLPYRVMVRRSVPRVLPDAPVEIPSEEEVERVFEEYLEDCGATGGDVPEFSRFGVTVGPARSSVPFVPNLEAAVSPQGLEVVLPDTLTVGNGVDTAVLYNFEYGRSATKLGTDSFVGTPLGSRLLVPQSVVGLFSCRTSAVLVEFRSGDQRLLRSKLSGQTLGLGRRCNETDE